MQVFEFGDIVKIKLLELYGFVTAICYHGDNISYEISFFSNGEYHQKWMESFEFEKINEALK